MHLRARICQGHSNTKGVSAVGPNLRPKFNIAHAVNSYRNVGTLGEGRRNYVLSEDILRRNVIYRKHVIALARSTKYEF